MISDRVRQFLRAGVRPTAGDFALAREWLSPPLFALFSDQHPRDVVHAAETARWLLRHAQADPDLIVAALVHDVAKGRQRRADRAVYVISSGAGLDGWLAEPRSRLAVRRAVDRSRRHAAEGARILRENGAGERVVDLTARHHSDPSGDAMLASLQRADALC